MKGLIRNSVIVGLIFCTAFAARAQELLRFSAVFSPPESGACRFELRGSTLEYLVVVLEFSARNAAIHGPESPGLIGPVLFQLSGEYCFTPLPPDSPGSCVWRGNLSLTETQKDYLVSERLWVRVDAGHTLPPAVQGRIFLDNNQNRIPDREEDTDLDGVSDADDLCPETPAGVPVDSRGCSIDDLDRLCPCSGPRNNHGKYVSCIGENVSRFVREGIVSRKDAELIVREAAQSNCGKKE